MYVYNCVEVGLCLGLCMHEYVLLCMHCINVHSLKYICLPLLVNSLFNCLVIMEKSALCVHNLFTHIRNHLLSDIQYCCILNA